MFSFPTISITSSTPFVFDPISRVTPQRVSYLEIRVAAGSADIYVGPWPDDASSVGTWFNNLTLANEQSGFNPYLVGATVDANVGLIRPGWVVGSGELVDIGKYITRVDGNNLTFNNTLSTYAAGDLNLLPPFSADITSGFLLSPELWKSWSAEHNSLFLSTPLKFAVSSGTGTLNLAYDIA